MPTPTVAEFWDLLVRSGLVDAGAVATLCREHAVDPGARDRVDGKAIARWLAERGVLTRWQAKRLGIGNLGPFFLGDYRLLERHDGDGSELVFTARHDPSGRVVSLVLLDSKRCRELDIWTEIVHRTTAANTTTDPMLSRTWSLEQHDGKRFIVCEQVAGTNLADELEKFGPLPAVQAGVLVSQVARAVADLHSRGAIHGGLSLDGLRREPSPGGVDRTGRVRLLQFPSAGDPHRVPLKPWNKDDEIPALGRRAAYVAPELTLPGAVCDQRSDVYSLGAILYALLSGTPPCWEGDAKRTLRQAAFGDGAQPLGPPAVSPEMATLVGYLMARDPNDRYQTAAEAAEAIAACLGLAGTAPVATRPSAGGRPVAATTEGVGGLPALDEAGELPNFTVTTQPAAVRVTAGESTGESAAVRMMRRRAARLRLLGGAVTAAFLAGVVAIVVSRTDFKSPPLGPPPIRPPRVTQTDPPKNPLPPPAEEPGERPSLPPAVEPARPAVAIRQIVVEDATLPWASPTAGPRPRLAYLPPGSQLVLLARPADMAADEEGWLFLKSLGPLVEGALTKLAAFCGCQVSDIDAVQAGWQAGEADNVIGGYAVRLVEGRTVVADEAARRAAWGATKPEVVSGETIHIGKPFSFWVPSAAGGGVLVIASNAELEADIPATPGTPAVRESFITTIVRQSLTAKERPADVLLADLPLQLETLASMLDADRHVTLFGSPYYLLNRGRSLLAGPLAKLSKPLEDLFGDSIRGASLSAHFGANTYLELAAVAERDPPAMVLAPQLAGRVDNLAPAVEEYCALLNPSPYGRVLVMRLPGMLRTLTANMRVGTEGNGVVVNAYLPRHAAHNLALATELALSQSPGAAVAAAPVQPAAASASDALGKLQKKITLVFARDTLEKAIEMLAEETGLPMEILGNDLQLDGITQNQSFGLDQRDQTAADVLRLVLTQANPDGKLVYIIRTEAAGEKIFITTRGQAEKRGDPLPPAFQPDPGSEKKNKP